MCGIIAYSGHQAAAPILMGGLRSLEYRGYDSSGIAFIQQGSITAIKAPGKLDALEARLEKINNPLLATCGIGHTRWATHGAPTETNAHPHLSADNKFALIHNGIIENFREIKEELLAKGWSFQSETDTEVLVNLIAECRKTEPDTLHAFRKAVKMADGAYSLVLLPLDEPDTLYATRKSAPLIAGVGTGENFVASDVTAFLKYTRRVIFLDEGEIIRITPNSYRIMDLESLDPIEKEIHTIEWDVQSAQKGGFKHFMLKEIFEQPNVLRQVLAGRVPQSGDHIRLPELENDAVPPRLRIVACGTSYNAGCWAAPIIEQWAGIPTSVEIASEFRYRKPVLDKSELVILISQSGETADTMGALEVARGCGCSVLGLCNVIGSSLARQADRVIYTQAGPEISVASTKALCSQMALLTILAIYWGQTKGLLDEKTVAELLEQFMALPEQLERALPRLRDEVHGYAVTAAQARNLFFLGRGQSWSMAMEGALKFKELSYVHAEAYAAGEMKHGPIALIDPEFLTIAIAPADEHYGKISSNIQEICARSGPVIALTQRDAPGQVQADYRWEIPPAKAPFTSFLLLPMLQLLSYEAASYLGKDVDQPRNLAKSVTVE